MNHLISISSLDLLILRDALVAAKLHSLCNEKRCRELADGCSSESFAASFLHGADLARVESANYERLLNEFSKI